ncbi:MAG: sulfotransferase [Pseudomonadota bacterium]
MSLSPGAGQPLNNLGIVLRARGQLDEALKVFEETIALAPDVIEPRMNLVEIHLEREAVPAAKAALAAVTARAPDLPGARHAAGAIAALEGRFDDAVAAFEGVVESTPNVHPTVIALADVLRRRGDHARARTVLTEAIEREPHPSLWWTLGQVCRAGGDLDAAHRAYRQAVVVDADPEPGLVIEAANVAIRVGDLDAARRTINAVDDTRVPAPLASAFLGAKARLLVAERRPGEAVPIFEQAISMAPNAADLHHALGEAYQAAGRFVDAAQSLERAITLDSSAGRYYESLVQTRRFASADDPLAQTMRGMMQSGDLSAGDRASLAFALAKICDDAGDSEEAAHYYEAGNNVQRERYPFDVEEHVRWTEAIRRSTYEHIAPLGIDATVEPIFIVGMPRSGTTLVEQILSAHPACAAAGEVVFFDALRVRGESYPTYLSKLHEVDCRDIATTYENAIRSHVGDDITARLITDKMPTNFLYLGLIAAIFPNARLVHCVRDPIDVCVSVYKQNFAAALGNAYSFDLRALGVFYRTYASLMAHWRTLLGERVFDVSYVSLTRDPESTTRALLDHCAMDWDDQVLRPEENESAVRTASSWQVRQGIYQSSVGRGQQYQRWLQPLLDELGGVIEDDGSG